MQSHGVSGSGHRDQFWGRGSVQCLGAVLWKGSRQVLILLHMADGRGLRAYSPGLPIVGGAPVDVECCARCLGIRSLCCGEQAFEAVQKMRSQES